VREKRDSYEKNYVIEKKIGELSGRDGLANVQEVETERDSDRESEEKRIHLDIGIGLAQRGDDSKEEIEID
jgi:hypothetical protein